MIQVLRCYDTRFRNTSRKPTVYLAESCKEIVGDKDHGAQTVIQVDEQDVGNTEEDKFWNPAHKKYFLVISIPYRKGIHYAKRPRSFLPIIDQLQKLHKAGYVHGDIRAFNTVFGEKKDGPGYLIDFDFSAVPNSVYPEGYNRDLPDGDRIGVGYSGALPDDQKTHKNEQMQTWHDWYALGKLMFAVHRIQIPKDVTDKKLKEFVDLKDFWLDINEESAPKEIDIEQLKELLRKIDTANYKVAPSGKFQMELDNLNSKNRFTNVGATGSPLKNN